MKRNKLLLLLALLLTAATGAWATDVYLVGNGNSDGNWLNGVAWDPGASGNKMTEQNGVYSITFNDVDANSDLLFKFAINGSWDVNYGCTSWDANELNKTLSNIEEFGNNIKFGLTEKADVTISFNLSELTYMISTKGMKVGDDAATGYTVSLKDGVKDADKWTVKVGEGQAQALPIGGLKGDGKETVTLQYNGRLKVKGVKATSEAAAEEATYTLLSAATTADCGKVVCAAGHLHDAKTAVPDGCTAVGILGKVTETGHGLILALKDATAQNWNTINGWTSVTTYAGTTLKVLPDDAARGTNLTSYTALGATTVSNWAVAQHDDYSAIFLNLGSEADDYGDGKTYDDNVNAYITGAGGTTLSGAYCSATEAGNNVWNFESGFWSYDNPKNVNRKVRPVLGFGGEAAAAKEAATVTAAPTGAAVVGVGKTTALVSGGVADGGTMMYKVTTENTKPTSTDGFSGTVPTAEGITASGKVYVWYYVKGDDTHSDSEIAATAIEVTVAQVITWNSSNVSDLRVTYKSYTKEGVTLSANGEWNEARWRNKGEENGIYFEAMETGGYTFTAPNGKKFTKIEMKAQDSIGWDIANLGTGWAINNTTITWTGSAASTVGLLTDAGNFNGKPVNSIVFYLVNAE